MSHKDTNDFESLKESSSNPSEINKFCRNCKSKISYNADTCSNCGKSQNWKRHVYFYGALLGLILTALTLFKMGFPEKEEKDVLTADSFLPKYNMSAEKISIKKDVYKVRVKNLGQENITLGRIQLNFKDERFDLKPPNKTIVIKPGDSKVLRLKVHDITDPLEDQMSYNNRYCSLLLGAYGDKSVLQGYRSNTGEKWGGFTHIPKKDYSNKYEPYPKECSPELMRFMELSRKNFN